MIKFENFQVVGLDHAIRGMRNAMNSWDKSDSHWNYTDWDYPTYYVGENDLELMKKLASAGTSHSKYRRAIVVYVDITAPLYWWKEFDTYKVGTVSNSCSTMHKIHAKEFDIDDFSVEHLFVCDKDAVGIVTPMDVMAITIDTLNYYRQKFIETGDKDYWWQMIQLLPSTYNQKRSIVMNYEVLANIYETRENHKLDEWRHLCKWIEQLPWSEVITGERND